MVMAADIAVWYITAAQRVKRISIKEREDPCTGGLEGGGESSWGGGGGGDLIGAATGNPLVIALPDPATVPRPRYTGRAAEGAQTHYCFSLIFILYVLPFIPFLFVSPSMVLDICNVKQVIRAGGADEAHWNIG